MKGKTSIRQKSAVLLATSVADSTITLAYADALDLRIKPGWAVQLVDMVLHEVTRNVTLTSQATDAGPQRHRFTADQVGRFRHIDTGQVTQIVKAPGKRSLIRAERTI